MKLIQILALATAMATMATAQNYLPQQAKVGLAGGPTSANGQQSGGATPSPTATPAAKGTGKPQTAGKTSPAKGSSATKTGPGSATQTKNQASSTKAAAVPAASPKPAVKTSTGTVKGQTGAATTSTQAKAKATATPVVAVKTSAGPAASAKTDTKKTDTKKTSSKKADTAKTPGVIAVKPAQGPSAKKTGATQTKTKAPAPTPAPKVAEAAPAAKAVEKPKPASRFVGAHGRRDPFVSPIRAGRGDLPTPTCNTGKRCLSIPELVLQGTVKDMTGKMMAVVANSTKRTYFLRENDQVFNGSVEKITSDSIIFREFIKDALGRETAREVVKKLVPAS